MTDSVQRFNTLPEEVKRKVISDMGAFSEVNVTKEWGNYSVSPDHFLSSNYAPDHQVWSFTKEELKKQYAEQIEAEEKRYYEEGKDCNWESLND